MELPCNVVCVISAGAGMDVLDEGSKDDPTSLSTKCRASSTPGRRFSRQSMRHSINWMVAEIGRATPFACWLPLVRMGVCERVLLEVPKIGPENRDGIDEPIVDELELLSA